VAKDPQDGREDIAAIRDALLAILFEIDRRLNYLEIATGESPELHEQQIKQLAQLMGVEGSAHDIITRFHNGF